MIALLRTIRSHRGVLFAATLAAALCGCQPLWLNSIFHPGTEPGPVAQLPAPPSSASPAPQSTASPSPAAHSASSVSSKKHRASAPRPSVAEPEAPSNENAVAPVLSLVPAAVSEVEASQQRDVEQALDAASQKLGTLDRSKLTGQNAADYDDVAAMVNSARRALAAKDFLRAQSLAGKASVLAAQLAGRSATTAR